MPQFQPLNLSLAAGTKPLPMVAVGMLHLYVNDLMNSLVLPVSCTDPRGLPEKIFGVMSNGEHTNP